MFNRNGTLDDSSFPYTARTFLFCSEINYLYLKYLKYVGYNIFLNFNAVSVSSLFVNRFKMG